MADKEEPQTYARRNFFREGLREMLNPLANLLADRLDNLPDFSSLTPQDGPEEVFFIRPPGAQTEERFLETCIRCGCCKTACPFDVISILRREDISEAGQSSAYSWRPYRETGTPRIDPVREPCRMCTDFPCAAACPSGALITPSGKAVIGTAAVNEDTCLRTFKEDCTACVDACPEGEEALRIRRNKQVHVRTEGCTGCGFCENVCPVEPAAIRVYRPEPDFEHDAD